MRDGPDDSRSGLTEVCLGQLAPFIDDYKTALGVYALVAVGILKDLKAGSEVQGLHGRHRNQKWSSPSAEARGELG